MPVKINLTRNNNRIGLFDLDRWIEKYAQGVPSGDGSWIIYTDSGLSVAKSVLPTAGYDVSVVEVMDN